MMLSTFLRTARGLVESLLSLRPLPREEFLENFFAVLQEDAADDGRPMIQPSVFRDLVERVAGARFAVGRTIDDRRQARLHDGAGTHRARFERAVKRAVQQSPGSQRLCGLSDGDHFSVRRRVAELFSLVVPRPDNLLVVHDDSADRDFLLFEGLSRQV